jgi:methyl-accepting chemotaxis protein
MPSGIDLVENALKIANNFNKTKKQLEMEINTLKKKVNEKEDKQIKDHMERLKFNEGSFWMSKKINNLLIIIVGRVINEMENFSSRIDELISDYDNRLRGISIDNELNNKILNNARSWFMQTFESMINDVMDKFREWHFNAQKNLDIVDDEY